MNELTNSQLHKVSYFCTTKNEVVVEHLGSLNFPAVIYETVFKAIADLVT